MSDPMRSALLVGSQAGGSARAGELPGRDTDMPDATALPWPRARRGRAVCTEPQSRAGPGEGRLPWPRGSRLVPQRQACRSHELSWVRSMAVTASLVLASSLEGSGRRAQTHHLQRDQRHDSGFLPPCPCFPVRLP